MNLSKLVEHSPELTCKSSLPSAATTVPLLVIVLSPYPNIFKEKWSGQKLEDKKRKSVIDIHPSASDQSGMGIIVLYL